MLRTFLFRFHSWRADRANDEAIAYLRRPASLGWDDRAQMRLDARATRLAAKARTYA